MGRVERVQSRRHTLEIDRLVVKVPEKTLLISNTSFLTNSKVENAQKSWVFCQFSSFDSQAKFSHDTTGEKLLVYLFTKISIQFKETAIQFQSDKSNYKLSVGSKKGEKIPLLFKNAIRTNKMCHNVSIYSMG